MAQHPRHALPQRPRGLVVAARDARQPRLDRSDRDRKEPRQIGIAQRQPRADQDQPRIDAEERAGRLPDPAVEARRGDQDAQRQDRARHGIADRGRAVDKLHPPLRKDAGGIGDDQPAGQHRDRRQRRQHEAVARLGQQAVRQARELEALPCLDRQIQRGQQEAEEHRQEAQGQRGKARPPAQRLAREAAGALAADRIALPPARPAFQRDQRHHQQQHGQRDLRRARQVGSRDPGRVDRDRQRPHAQELGRADVVQRLHQGEADAHRDGGARQRQGHAAEDLPPAGAQGPGDLDQVRRLGHEHRPRRQVDVRVKDKAQQQDRPRHRADVGQAELSRTVIAEDRANQRLERPQRVQQVQIGIGHDIGGHRQGQQQRPFQHAPPREVMGRHQPGGRSPDRRRQHPDAAHQDRRLPQRVGQDVPREMRPQALGPLRGLPQQRQHRDQDQRRDQQAGRDPGSSAKAERPGGSNAVRHPGHADAGPRPAISCRSRRGPPAR